MKTDDEVKAIAGSLVTISSILAVVHSKYWLIITIFVGLNLFQYSLSRWCLLKNLLDKKPIFSRE